MAQIVQQSALNLTALYKADLYVDIVPPSALSINGVPSARLGVVGTASWGQVGGAGIVGSAAQYAGSYGPMVARKFDAGTHVAAAVLQGAQDFRVVRVTDATDVAAMATVASAELSTANLFWSAAAAAVNAGIGVTRGASQWVRMNASTGVLSGLFTGSLGNSVVVTVTKGSKTGTYRLVVGVPGTISEVYDNLPIGSQRPGQSPLTATASGSTATFAGSSIAGQTLSVTVAGKTYSYVTVQGDTGTTAVAALAALITGATASADVLTAPSAVTAATATGVLSYALSGGTDGASGVTAQSLVGIDGNIRTGMYALRNSGCSVAWLADADDSTTWTAQTQYGLTESTYMLCQGPAGDTITNAIAVKASAGIDNYSAAVLFGDWCWFQDNVNQEQRLISPQAYLGGLYGNLTPNNSCLNKQLFGILGTQKSGAPGGIAQSTYSNADITALSQAGIEVIANPAPGGSWFACQVGLNSSSNQATDNDTYSRMTNYIASTIGAVEGRYVGTGITPTQMLYAKVSLTGFFSALVAAGYIIGFSVQLDASNNSQAQTSLGIEQAGVMVQYESIARFFVVNLQGGASVVPVTS